MAYAYRPQPASDRSASPNWSLPSKGRLLSEARRSALYDAAPSTEQLPSQPLPASLTGQLRVLELQRDNLMREIEQLRAQLPSK